MHCYFLRLYIFTLSTSNYALVPAPVAAHRLVWSVHKTRTKPFPITAFNRRLKDLSRQCGYAEHFTSYSFRRGHTSTRVLMGMLQNNGHVRDTDRAQMIFMQGWASSSTVCQRYICNVTAEVCNVVGMLDPASQRDGAAVASELIREVLLARSLPSNRRPEYDGLKRLPLPLPTNWRKSRPTLAAVCFLSLLYE